MRKWPLLILGMLLGAAGPAARAQGPDPEVIYSRYALFQIPFQAGPGAQRLRQLQLFVSTDRGRSWQPAATTTPDQRAFRFEAERDGLHWFTVQTLDRDGRYFPATLDNARPSLKVFVKTQPPAVDLEALPARGNQVGVRWTITDDTNGASVPGALRLDYRLVGGKDWQALPVDPASDRYYWDPRTDGQIEVRLRARDRAENWAEKKLVLDGSGQGAAPAPSDPEQAAPVKKQRPVTLAPDANVRMVKSKQFSLSYNVKDVGPSKVSTVDVWYTQDGNNWQKYRTQECTKEPDAAQYALTLEVREEGLYGFTLVVHSGVGLSERPPQVGDRPQVWVEVDVTPPEVRLKDILVGRGANKGKLFVTWSARDKNLGREPITLSYATQADGPWTRIAEKLPNNGRYIWQMPADVPYQFLVKVEATDKAGNVGSAVTPELIKVDLSQPKTEIINVEPVGK